MSASHRTPSETDTRPERVDRRRRRAIRLAGGLFLAAGAALLLAGSQQQRGTAMQELRAQSQLRAELAPRIEPNEPVEADAPTVEAPRAAVSTTVTAAPLPSLGEPVAVLRIPRIGVDKVVVEGVGTEELKQGPGHYPTTPLPGLHGNVAIAGHRTTYGAPFYAIDELEPGDEIILTTEAGDARYLVTGATVVSPTDVGVLEPTGRDQLTLTTCEPRYSARFRLVVTAELDGQPFDVPAPHRRARSPI